MRETNAKLDRPNGALVQFAAGEDYMWVGFHDDEDLTLVGSQGPFGLKGAPSWSMIRSLDFEPINQNEGYFRVSFKDGTSWEESRWYKRYGRHSIGLMLTATWDNLRKRYGGEIVFQQFERGANKVGPRKGR